MILGKSHMQAVPSGVSKIDVKSKSLDQRQLEPDIDLDQRTLAIDGQLNYDTNLFQGIDLGRPGLLY